MHDGLLLCDDLIFTSRIVGEASAQGLTLRVVKKARELLQLFVQMQPRCVIVDLQTESLDFEELVRAAQSNQTKATVVGYGSHVDVATLKRARDAGIDVVWPRSKFVEELAAALPQWFDSAPRSEANPDGR